MEHNTSPDFVSVGKPDPKLNDRENNTHFGIRLRNRPGGHYLTAENFLDVPKGQKDIILEDGSIGKTDFNSREIDIIKAKAIFSFHLNMSYFMQLDRDAFETHVDDILHNRLGTFIGDWVEVPTFDDPSMKAVPGLYLMVLDKYKQIYVGSSTDIKRRICTHWSTRKPLSRMVSMLIWESKLPIDAFRAKDTTRIFCIPEYVFMRDYELDLMQTISPQFSLNRSFPYSVTLGLPDLPIIHDQMMSVEHFKLIRDTIGEWYSSSDGWNI